MRAPLALLVALAACGTSGGAPVDGGGDGGSRDIDADPDVRGTVTVRIVDKNAAPLAGMHVVFIDTDTTVTEVLTDSAGAAQGSVFPGASVTAVRARSNGSSYSLATVLQLVPGDDITLTSGSPDGISSEDPFTARAVPLPSADISSLVKSGSATLATTRTPHGLAPGDIAIVRDVLQLGYNGDWVVQTAPSATTFTYAYTNNTPGNGGTAAKGIPVTVTFPAYAGTTFYEVHTACGPFDVGAATSAQVALRAGCSESPMDIVVFAKSSATTELAYIGASAASWTAGGTIDIAGPWQALAPFQATYTNPTTRVSDIVLGRHLPYLRGPASSTATATAMPTTNLDVSSGRAPIAWSRTTLRCPAGSTSDCISSDVGTAQQTVVEKIDGTAATYTLDIGANLLPWVSAEYLPASQTIDMTITGTGTIDLMEASLRYVRAESSSQVIYTWRVFGPVAEDVTFPVLPSTIPGDPTVRATDTQSEYRVNLCETDAVNGYRAAVANPFATLGTCESTGSTETVPYGGTKNRLSRWN